MCVYVCMCVLVVVCVYVFMCVLVVVCVDVCMCVLVVVCVHVCVGGCMLVCVCVGGCGCMWVCVYVCVGVHSQFRGGVGGSDAQCFADLFVYSCRAELKNWACVLKEMGGFQRLGLARTTMYYIRYFWQGNHQIYSHVWCKYTVIYSADIQSYTGQIYSSGRPYQWPIPASHPESFTCCNPKHKF